MVTNRRLVKSGPDFYPTPPWATRALMYYIDFQGNILEPCCGEGDMAKVLAEKYEVISSDKYDRGYGQVKDFFEIWKPYDNIVTNPPFVLAEKVFQHSWFLAKAKIALLLRTSFLESKRRYETIFDHTPPKRVLVFSERLSMYPKGYIIQGGGTTSYSWFIWNKHSAQSSPTEITWIKPGFKGAKL